MLKRQREMYADLLSICNKLGTGLDATATHPQKYRERQEAHKLVSKAIYGITNDVPENPHREQDREDAKEAIQNLKKLQQKKYPDRQGFYT